MNDEKPVIGDFLNLTDNERHELISGVLSNIDFSKARRALEHAGKSKLVTDFVQFLTNFSLERVLRGLILKTAEDRLQRCDLDKDDARYLTEGRDKFLSSFDTIASWSNPEHRQVALTAVLSTLVIAMHGKVQEDLIKELRRGLTKPANKARHAADVDEIIESRARVFWGRGQSFKYNNLGTAKKIHKAVVADLQACISTAQNKIPPKWHPVKSPDANSDRREIGRIAKRIAKIVRKDK